MTKCRNKSILEAYQVANINLTFFFWTFLYSVYHLFKCYGFVSHSKYSHVYLVVRSFFFFFSQREFLSFLSFRPTRPGCNSMERMWHVQRPSGSGVETWLCLRNRSTERTEERVRGYCPWTWRELSLAVWPNRGRNLGILIQKDQGQRRTS